MTTVTVSLDGSGDYNCTSDSVECDIQINNAFNYINSFGGGTVHIKAGTYIISNTIIMYDNTILEGEGFGTIIKLKNNAGWIQGKPLISNTDINNGLTVQNLKVDGNRINQSEGQGLNYYNAITFRDSSNILFTNLWIGNNLSDGIKVHSCNNIEINNTILYFVGHAAILSYKSTNLNINNNETWISTNSGVRLYNSNHAIIRNNIIHGLSTGDWGIQINQEYMTYVDDIIIEKNKIYDIPNSAIIMYAETTQDKSMATGIIIKNNLIYHSGASKELYTRGGIQIVNFNNTLIENNTIFNNYGNGIYFTDYIYNTTTPRVSWTLTATVKNNIIVSNTEYGLNIGNINSTFNSLYNDIYNNTLGSYNGSIVTTTDISVDPLLYLAPIRLTFKPGETGLIIDFHLKSVYGRYEPVTKLWINDTETSSCIQAGDPSSDNSLSLWNGIIEIGVYGNTPEASNYQIVPCPQLICAITITPI